MTTQLDRRRILAGGAALGLAAATTPLQAAAPQLGTRVPHYYRFMIGQLEVTTIRDGAAQFPGPHPIFGQNVSAEEVEALAVENFLPPRQMEVPFTVTLVNTGSELILFDTGNGDTGRRPAAGQLLARLSEVGYAPEQIDVVVLTHFHGDHIGGLTENGAPTFPNARYVTSAEEHNFWTDEALLSNEAMASRAQLVQNKVAPFNDRTSFIAPGETVASGIEAVRAFGHTPGHMAFHLESEGERLMLIADTSNHYVASLLRPDWHVSFDMDKEAAVATRKEVLGMVAADRIPFVGYHMPTPAVGYLEAEGAGFRYVAASYQLNL